ncbi:MAG: DUF1467 family protein [Janthinobacterium lividum]
MRWYSGLVIYVLFWMLTLFAVLPFGVRTSAEADEEEVAGQANSAPVNPMLGRKMLWTSLVSGVLFAVYYANYVNGWVTIADIPVWG